MPAILALVRRDRSTTASPREEEEGDTEDTADMEEGAEDTAREGLHFDFLNLKMFTINLGIYSSN